MRIRPYLRPIVLGLALLVVAPMATTRAAAQQDARQAPVLQLPSETQRIPVDPAISVGRLPNGLRYYVRRNPRPANRAELRLVVDAGSVLEEDDQLGLAHFVEHMAFNGTRNFRGQEIGAFMESIGMRFGPSLNAFTSFDDTTFVLQVPTDRPGVMERAFLIMDDWARHVTFDPVEIDKERGVIVEEWRLRRGPAARIQDQLFPILLKGSRYAVRPPIGTKESIETFPHERLRQFYRDWYRPDLMAVVAVGDFDRAAVERMIRERFSQLPPSIAPRTRARFPVPDHEGTVYAVVTDREASSASITVYNKLPLREQSTVMSYRQRIIDHLYAGMLNARLAELGQRPDPPFLAAGVNRGIFVRTKEVATMTAIVDPSRVDRGLEAMLTEAARVTRHGFTETEFEREKRDLLRIYEQAAGELGKDESAPLADEYIRNFLTDESIPGIVWEHAQHQRFLPGITLAEVNALAREWTGDRNRVVVLSAPEAPGVALPTEARLAEVVAAAAAVTPEPYVDDHEAADLMAETPTPGKIVRETTIPEVGITEWVLSNGVRVALKPTTFKQDEFVIRATSPGGSSLAPNADSAAAMSASQVVTAGGVGDLDLVGLRKALAGTVASVTPMIGETHEGLIGGGSVRDAETVFQLVHLYFTRPRADRTVFEVMTGQMKAMLANRRANPEAVFEDLVQTTVAQGHVRARPLSPEVVDELSLDKSFAFYKDRFSDASDFTFVLAGSFTPDQMRPLVTTYLGSLPARGRRETWRDVGVRPPKGVIEKTLTMGIEPRSRVRLVFTGPFTWSPTERVALRTLGMVLEGQLGASLREEQSGTYGVKVTALHQRVPVPEFQVSIDFSCAPERTEELVKSLFAEIARLRADGPPAGHVRDIREALKREYETDSKENRYLVEEITRRYEDGEDIRGLYDLPVIYERITASMIRDAARAYLDPANHVRVTLYPESAKRQE